jgi:hypothetical protein
MYHVHFKIHTLWHMLLLVVVMCVCDMQMQRAFESPPTRLTVNQAAGVTVNAAAAAVQPAKASHARYLTTCSMTTTDGQHDETGGPGGVAPKLTVPAYGF